VTTLPPGSRPSPGGAARPGRVRHARVRPGRDRPGNAGPGKLRADRGPGVALLLFAALLAAPGGDLGAELKAVDSGQWARPDAAQTAAPDAAQTAMADTTMLVRVERMGGFAGVHESWTLQASGKVWFLPAPGVEALLSRTLGSDLMDQVQDLLGAGIGTAPVGSLGVECSDCFLYRVVVVGARGTRDIVVGEHRLGEASPGFRRLLGLVAGQGPPPFSFPVGATQAASRSPG
jgi:hypothetical protein